MVKCEIRYSEAQNNLRELLFSADDCVMYNSKDNTFYQHSIKLESCLLSLLAVCQVNKYWLKQIK